jgi:hypothetical protein
MAEDAGLLSETVFIFPSPVTIKEPVFPNTVSLSIFIMETGFIFCAVEYELLSLVNLQEPCVLYIGWTYRYPPNVAFYIYFLNKYKY